MQIPLVLYFVGNSTFFLAFLVRDILWLRTLAVIGALCTFPFYFTFFEAYDTMFYWQCAFASAHIFNIFYLLRERKPIKLSDEQRRIHSMVFKNLSTRDVVRLLSLARWQDFESGEKLVAQSRHIDKLFLISTGTLQVRVDGEFVRYMRDGEFVGELSHILQQRTTADVIVDEACRCLVWDRKVLEAFLDKNLTLKLAFLHLLNVDIAGKLAWHTYEKDYKPVPI
ncbi:MAG: cyclic nucleotide-binding domain-containing protein [Pseudomonadota bacterium]